jgi:hypothetical protein
MRWPAARSKESPRRSILGDSMKRGLCILGLICPRVSHVAGARRHLLLSRRLPSRGFGAIRRCRIYAVRRRPGVFRQRRRGANNRTLFNSCGCDSDGRRLQRASPKTRIMRQGVRQYLAGLVANRHLNVIRRDFDCLKATLTNCVRRGPHTQNRTGHEQFRSYLEGRVGFVEMINPAKGRRLRTLYDQIRWE